MGASVGKVALVARLVTLPAPDEIDGFGKRPAVIAKGKHVFYDWHGPRTGIARVDAHSQYSVRHKTHYSSDP